MIHRTRYPFAPQCSCYHGRDRCPRTASVRILSPEGSAVATYCRPCAEATRDEYAAYLGESWTLEPMEVLS